MRLCACKCVCVRFLDALIISIAWNATSALLQSASMSSMNIYPLVVAGKLLLLVL